MTKRPKFQEMLDGLRQSLGRVPEHRTGRNTQYGISDAGLAAFSVFYMQSPSFLAHQRDSSGSRDRTTRKACLGWSGYRVADRYGACWIPSNRRNCMSRSGRSTAAWMREGDRTSNRRSHWKVEKEGLNVFKNQGYNFEHNYGHGQQPLSTVLLPLLLLAFLFHTALHLSCLMYQAVRRELAVRRTFFNDLRALTRYLDFASWQESLSFMHQRLDLAP